MPALRALLFVSFLFGNGYAFHFELSTKLHVQRCFYEELEQSTEFQGTYKVRDYEANNEDFQPGAVYIRVIDPNGQDMLQREYKDQGSFAFHSNMDGSYEICFLKVPTEKDVISRVYLHYVHTYPDTAVDKTMADEAEMSDDSVETESDMEKVFWKLDEAYGQSWRMYASYKKREKFFRGLSKTTNSRIIWWGILQVIVLLVTAAWQMRHLTKFFIAKKIV